MKEASINAKQAGERGISAKSVKKVTEVGTHSVHLNGPVLTGVSDVTIEVQGLSSTGILKHNEKLRHRKSAALERDYYIRLISWGQFI